MARTFGPIGELTVAGVPIQLAPDLTFLERTLSPSLPYERDTVVMVAGVEKEILTYSSKKAVSFLYLSALANESMTCRLEVDGVEIWDSTVTITDATWALYGDIVSGDLFTNPAFQVDTLSLFLTTTTDTSIDISHIGRSIL